MFHNLRKQLTIVCACEHGIGVDRHGDCRPAVYHIHDEGTGREKTLNTDVNSIFYYLNSQEIHRPDMA